MKKKSRFLNAFLLSLILPVIVLLGIGFSGCGSAHRPKGPGDIYTDAGYPCVTAHSTTRALYADYDGPLYQVMRQSDSKTLDIGVVQAGKGDPGGYADAAAQDEFCANTVCWISIVYDQSGNNNHLVQAPPELSEDRQKVVLTLFLSLIWPRSLFRDTRLTVSL